jgi:hypothetical protein
MIGSRSILDPQIVPHRPRSSIRNEVPGTWNVGSFRVSGD